MFSAAQVAATSESPPAVAENLPEVTVIVPTYNRATSLADTLDGLVAQDYPPDRLTVVVVDEASTDGTRQVVHAAAARAPFPLQYYCKPKQGPAAARNHGLARSSGEIVGFTDSDCRVAAGWVRHAVRWMTPNVGIVAGPIHPTVRARRRPGFFQHQIGEVLQESDLYPTANVFYRRQALEQVGGFDEHFGAFRWGPPAFGEDTDVAWRVKRAGYQSTFAMDAGVEHEASPMSARDWLLDAVRVQHLPYLVSRVPELRQRYLWHRYFLGWGDLIFVLAVLGALATIVRSSRWLGMALPWLWVVRGPVMGDRWPPVRWWRIPVKYALLAERSALATAALVYGSVRHRTLVL